MPRNPRYEPPQRRQNERSDRCNPEPYEQDRDDYEQERSARRGSFGRDNTGFYDRSERNEPRRYSEGDRYRDRADRYQSSYDDTYRGSGGYGADQPDRVTLPAGATAHRREQTGIDTDRFRGKGPKGYTKSDDRIQDEVCERMADDGQLDASGISVSVSEGEVTLDGEVDSRRAKRLAEDCAESVSGVKHCQNNLRVSSGNETSQSDTVNAGQSSGKTPRATKG